VQVESDYKYRCVRAKRRRAPTAPSGFGLGLRDPGASTGLGLAAFTLIGSAASNGAAPQTMYGDPNQDQGDEVRFYVELTKLDGLKDTYSIDIRRLKGNLRSYKFLYDCITECVFTPRPLSCDVALTSLLLLQAP
ncbi:hypothetical protein BC826DRAFT_920043, partial [Russula brevipes]